MKEPFVATWKLGDVLNDIDVAVEDVKRGSVDDQVRASIRNGINDMKELSSTIVILRNFPVARTTNVNKIAKEFDDEKGNTVYITNHSNLDNQTFYVLSIHRPAPPPTWRQVLCFTACILFTLLLIFCLCLALEWCGLGRPSTMEQWSEMREWRNVLNQCNIMHHDICRSEYHAALREVYNITTT